MCVCVCVHDCQVKARSLICCHTQGITTGAHILELARLAVNFPAEFHNQATNALSLVRLGDRLQLTFGLRLILSANV